MKADAITRDSQNYLKQHRGRYLRVHSVFHKAINLINDDQEMLTLLDNSRDQGPNSIQLEFDASLAGLLPGDLVEVTDQELLFPRNGLTIETSGLKPDNLTLQLRQVCFDPEEMAIRYDKLRQVIVEDGCHEGLAPLIDSALPSNNYCSFVEHKIAELLNWIETGQVKKLRNGLSGILGFGPGLTPSTDDFLVGLILPAIVLSKYYTNPIFDVLIEDLPKIAIGKTTTISEEMIRLAAQAKISSNYKAFITGMFGKTAGNISQLARQVIKTGASSGTDFLFGIYSSKNMVLNQLGGTNAKSPSQKE